MWVYKGKLLDDKEAIDFLNGVATGFLGIVGPSGCGKTRLIKEFQKKTGKEIDFLTWARAEELAVFSVRWPCLDAGRLVYDSGTACLCLDHFDLLCSFRRETRMVSLLLEFLSEISTKKLVILMMSDFDTVQLYLEQEFKLCNKNYHALYYL